MSKAKKNTTWTLPFFEPSPAIRELGFEERGVIYVWLLDLEGQPVSRSMLVAALTGSNSTRRSKKAATELISRMNGSGFIIASGERVALSSQLVSNILSDGSRVIGQWLPGTRPLPVPFLGVNHSESKEKKNDSATREDKGSEVNGRPGETSLDENMKSSEERRDQSDAGEVSALNYSNLVSSLAPISGASVQEILSVISESNRLYAISYPSSEPDDTYGIHDVLKKLKVIVEENEISDILKKIRLAYSQGLSWVEKRGEKITLAAIVNGFQYITEKKKPMAQPKGKLVIKAGTYEPAEDSFPGLKIDPAIVAAARQERQNGG